MSGSWIFLSHSSHDIKVIRQIRNKFEDYGHNPLAFHLKCLKDDTQEGVEEICQLLKREIDARDWFVFCESEYAKKSKYVNFERSYILNSGKNKVWTIDLSQDIDTIFEKIHQISKDLNIYVSYDNKDFEYGEIIVNLLQKNDFTVWTDSNSINECSNTIYKSVVYGAYIMLITENSLERNQKEIDYILNCCNGGETILPVFIGTNKLDAMTECWYRSGPHINIKSNPNNDDFNIIVSYMEKYINNAIQNE